MPTDDDRLHRVDDADMLQTTTLILFDYVFFAAYVQATIRFWRNCAVVCVPVFSDHEFFPATLRGRGVSGACLLFASWLSDVDVETMVVFQRNCNDYLRYADFQ